VADVHRLLHWAVEEGVALEGFEVKRPSLEDVYLSLTDDRSVDGGVPGAEGVGSRS